MITLTERAKKYLNSIKLEILRHLNPGTFISDPWIGRDKVEGADITANYLLDNGQRVDYYGIGSIIRKTGVPAPSNGDILVFYSYFDANPFESFYYSTYLF